MWQLAIFICHKCGDKDIMVGHHCFSLNVATLSQTGRKLFSTTYILCRKKLTLTDRRFLIKQESQTQIYQRLEQRSCGQNLKKEKIFNKKINIFFRNQLNCLSTFFNWTPSRATCSTSLPQTVPFSQMVWDFCFQVSPSVVTHNATVTGHRRKLRRFKRLRK